MISVSVCLPVCLSVCPLAYLKTTRPNVTKFSVHIISGNDSILLRQQCDMLCTFGFVDDVMSLYNAGNRPESKTTHNSSTGGGTGGGICRLRLHLVFCLLFCLLVKRGIALTGRNSTGPPWSVTDDDRRQLQSITSLAPVHYV